MLAKFFVGSKSDYIVEKYISTLKRKVGETKAANMRDNQEALMGKILKKQKFFNGIKTAKFVQNKDRGNSPLKGKDKKRTNIDLRDNSKAKMSLVKKLNNFNF